MRYIKPIWTYLTGCKFSVVQIRRASARIEGSRIRREECAEKKAGDSAPECGSAMRVIAMFSGLCAAAAPTARGSVFFRDFKRLSRLPKLATSYECDRRFLAHENPIAFTGGLLRYGICSVFPMLSFNPPVCMRSIKRNNTRLTSSGGSSRRYS